MRILVIDDTELNLESARQTLEGHEVTTLNSYDEAVRHLDREVKFNEYIPIMAEILGCDPCGNQWRGIGLEKGERHDRYYAAEKQAKDVCRPPVYDAVLCDLLMPAGKDRQGPIGDKFVGKEIPVGFSLALLAALRGAKYVAVVSATNHHEHPASAMLDRLSGSGGYWDDEESKPLFTINGATVGFFPYPECKNGGKDWGKVLAVLMRDAADSANDPLAPD